MGDNSHSKRYAEFKTRLRQFIDERDWQQFHNPKDLAIAISLEASELLEHFLWKEGAEIDAHVASHHAAICDEAADVGIFLMELCDVLGIDLAEAMSAKLVKAGVKYPADKVKGTSRKHTELHGG